MPIIDVERALPFHIGKVKWSVAPGHFFGARVIVIVVGVAGSVGGEFRRIARVGCRSGLTGETLSHLCNRGECASVAALAIPHLENVRVQLVAVAHAPYSRARLLEFITVFFPEVEREGDDLDIFVL